jgi:pimeloyl-ACP methyl ester carboxylesterase
MRSLARYALTSALVVPPLLYAAACAMLYANQRKVLYTPVPHRNREVPTMALDGLDADVRVSIRPSDAPRAVVYFGGKSEDVSSTVPVLGAAFADAAIYALHYRGFGDSAGSPTESNLVADALALFDTVRRRHPDVIVIGRSLGTGVAIQIAARRRARRLVLVTPYDSIADVAATHFRAFPVRWIVQDRFESWRVAPTIRVPTTVIVAEFDTVIPLPHTRRLLQHFAPGVAHVVTLAGEDHGSFVGKPTYLEALRTPVPRRRRARVVAA